MRKHTLSILFLPVFVPSLTMAQLPPGSASIVFDPWNFQVNSATSASVTTPGATGGFDPNLALAPDLQQQVSSTNGLPLDNNIPQQYPDYWPGYSNASYGANYAPNSPEGNVAITLGTLQGTLQAGTDQQNSQMDELNRLEALEVANASAVGVLQALEVGNEIAMFEGEQEMKIRNSTNAQLNALVVAASNRQNREAQNELEGLGVATETAAWDATNHPPPPDPQIMAAPWNPQVQQ